MSITGITIDNFQAHKHLTFNFGQRITSITGASDRGKSAIIRALVWVITNRPSGDSFIRYGADECRVKVTVDNHTVERIKGKKRNVYILDGIEFKALKTDVPEEIQKIFNANSNNIQGQFDPIFWFSETAGEVGRNLNRIINLDIIDHTLGELQSDGKKVKTKIDVINGMIAEQEKFIANSDQIENGVKIIKRIGDFEAEKISIEKNIETLNSRINQCSNISSWLRRSKNWHETQNKLDLLLNEYIELDKQRNGLKTAIFGVKNILKTVKQNEIPENLFEMINRIEEFVQRLNEMRKNWKNLNGLFRKIQDNQDDYETAKKNAEEAEEKFHQLIRNNVCPLCGRGEEK